MMLSDSRSRQKLWSWACKLNEMEQEKPNNLQNTIVKKNRLRLPSLQYEVKEEKIDSEALALQFLLKLPVLKRPPSLLLRCFSNSKTIWSCSKNVIFKIPFSDYNNFLMMSNRMNVESCYVNWVRNVLVWNPGKFKSKPCLIVETSRLSRSKIKSKKIMYRTTRSLQNWLHKRCLPINESGKTTYIPFNGELMKKNQFWCFNEHLDQK